MSFGADTGSSRWLALILCDRALFRRILGTFDCRLKSPDAVSDSFAKFGKLLRTEHEQSDAENHQQMHGLKESFDHLFSLMNRWEWLWAARPEPCRFQELG